MENEAIARAATALTGGIGGQGDACGSLLGSSMIIGTVYGIDKKTVTDKERMNNAIGRAGAFYRWFREKHGSSNCREIVTRFGNGVYYDMGIPEQAQKAIELGVNRKCAELVETTVAHVIGELWDDVQIAKKREG